jgi:hypothetical protein
MIVFGSLREGVMMAQRNVLFSHLLQGSEENNEVV